MKRLFSILFLIAIFSVAAKSQSDYSIPMDKWLIYEGDTAAVVALPPIHVFPQMKFKSEKERQAYSRLVRDVRVAYPYARIIAYSIIETYEYMQTLPTEKEKQKYLEDVQKYMMAEYKPKMKKMTKNQGKILIKLVDRQCNTSSYNIVKALLGSFKATFYNTFASLFGNSLKAEYDPEGKDASIEAIVLQIEDGTLDLNYIRNYHSFK